MVFKKLTVLGKRWLIHKAKSGKSIKTYVVDPSTMSNKWTYGKNKNVVGGVNIGEYVKTGGSNYNLLTNNCHHASCRTYKIKG